MRKKAFFVINDFYPGGVEKMVYELVSRLDKRELNIEVLAVIGGGKVLDEFKEVVPVRLLGHVENYRSLQGRVKWILTAPIIFIRTIAYLGYAKPDIVVTSLYHADLLGITAARLTGIKDRVIIQHDVHKLGLLRKILKRGLAIKWATRYVAISNSVKDFLVDYFGANERRIRVIRNGIDVKRFKFARKDLNTEEVVIGSVGRLEKEKGYATLIRALKLLKEKGIEPSVIIVGGGSEKEKLKNEADNYGLNIEWVGVVKDPIPYLSKMDIVVIPSLEEGFGLTVAEALAAEKVVIASNLPAINDVILDKKNGHLFEPGDVNDLADKLLYLLQNNKHLMSAKKDVEKWAAEKMLDLDISKTISEYENFL
jgi:glycosyltransferase involved in cell wall biosynthesis